MFPTLEYIDWIRDLHPLPTHDLGTSDLRPGPRPAAPRLVPERLRDLPDPGGDAPLREWIADEYDVTTQEVLVTAGASHANFLAAAAAIDRVESRGIDDPRALVERPAYEPLVETPRTLGAGIDRFERPMGTASVDPDRVVAAADDRLALATVTNRHNPTGHLLGRDRLADLAAATSDAGGLFHVDEVYAPYVLDDAESDRTAGTAFGGPTAAGLPETVVTGSLTKFHGLGGLSLGWLIGPESVVERARDAYRYVPAVADPSVALARRFFANRDRLLDEARDHCRRNHEQFAAFCERRDDLSAVVRDGSPFGFVAHESLDGTALTRAALDADVLVVPGRFFDVPDGVRMALGRDPERCADALDAFGDVLDDL